MFFVGNTVKMWPTLQRQGKRENVSTNAVLQPRGRPKGTPDRNKEPRWKRVKTWAENTAEFAACLSNMVKEKEHPTLKDVAEATGRSPQMCSYLLKRIGYKFYLRDYTFALSETQKAYRKQMALDMERAVFELPDFIQVIHLPTLFSRLWTNCSFLIQKIIT